MKNLLGADFEISLGTQGKYSRVRRISGLGGGGVSPQPQKWSSFIKLKRSFTVSMQIVFRLARKLKPWWWSWTWGGPLAWKSKSGGRGQELQKILTKISAFEAFSSDLEAVPLQG